MDRLLDIFRAGAAELPSVWELFLEPALIADVARAASGPEPCLEDETFVRIIYSAAVGCARRRLPQETLLRSLIPVYLGKVATFVAQTRDATAEEAEERLEALALTYEREKPFLRSLWQAPGAHASSTKGGP